MRETPPNPKKISWQGQIGKYWVDIYPPYKDDLERSGLNFDETVASVLIEAMEDDAGPQDLLETLEKLLNRLNFLECKHVLLTAVPRLSRIYQNMGMKFVKKANQGEDFLVGDVSQLTSNLQDLKGK